ncbi:MAG: hypothetical protein ACR2RF_02820 [Geminicoccaceae bacterium]
MPAERLEPAKKLRHSTPSMVTDAEHAWNALTTGLSEAELDKLLSYDGLVESGGETPEDDREQFPVEGN